MVRMIIVSRLSEACQLIFQLLLQLYILQLYILPLYFLSNRCRLQKKPLNYAIALETRGYDKVFEHIGIEPSGHSFNEMVLDHRRVADGTGNKGLSTVVVVVVVVVRC